MPRLKLKPEKDRFAALWHPSVNADEKRQVFSVAGLSDVNHLC